MIDIMGLINLNESEDYLRELTLHRPVASVPFGGRYRLIDFVLSNMVNSGITNVGILFQHKYRSLMDHLRSGKEWDLDRKRDGLVILPPAYVQYPNHTHRGDVENFHSNIDYIYRSKQKYVLVTGVNMICNLNFQPLLALHQEKGADVTVLYTEKDCGSEDCTQSVAVEVSPSGWITDMQVNSGKPEKQKITLEMFIIDRMLLIKLVDQCIAHGDYDFIKHCLIKNMSQLKVLGYAHQGYLGRIHSIQSYFQVNMDLLKPRVWQELFSQSALIYTKVKDEPPAKYTRDAKVSKSLIAGGCHIAGMVENSILFRGVRVDEGAHIKDSIIMQKGEIARGVYLQNVICDKDVQISAGKQLRGEINYPFVIKKGRVI